MDADGREPSVLSGWLGQCGTTGLMRCQAELRHRVEIPKESTFRAWHRFYFKGNANTISQWEDRYAS